MLLSRIAELVGAGGVAAIGGGSVTVHPFTAMAVNADGWTINAKIGAAKDGGAYANLNNYSTPGLVLTVRGKSWTTGGVETTSDRTVLAVTVERQAYPNELLRNEAENGADCDVVLVLSSQVYSGETIVSCATMLAFFTDNGSGGSGTASSAQTPAVTNNSTLAYERTVGTWADLDREQIQSNSPTFRIAVAHCWAQQGQTVRAVKFLASDTHGNTVSTVVSAMSAIQFSGSGFWASIFEGALDFTGLTQGDVVTKDAIIYPWLGDAYQLSVNGATYPSPNFAVQTCVNDRTYGYGTAFAYVDGVGAAAAVQGGTTAVAVAAARTASLATGYATVALAAAGLQTYINASFGRNNCSGGVIILKKATTHTVSTFSARAVGPTPIVIEAETSGDKATTIFQDQGSSLSNGFPDLTLIRNITLKRTGAFRFFDCAATSTGNFMMNFDNCDFDDNGIAADAFAIGGVGQCTLRNCTGENWLQGARSGVLSKMVNMIGCSGMQPGSATYNMLACSSQSSTGIFGTVWTTSSANQVALSSFLGWSQLGNSSTSLVLIDIRPTTTNVQDIILIGMVGEKYTSNNQNVANISGDGHIGTATNCWDIACTFVGEGYNLLYNDSGTASVHKDGGSKLTVTERWACKTDTFNHPTDHQSGNRTGNWFTRYRVGGYYRVILHVDEVPGPDSTRGELSARGDVYAVDPARIDPHWVDDQSFTNSGSGNGDYRPIAASTELPQIPAGLTAFPFDYKGTAVPTNGTAYAGALQA